MQRKEKNHCKNTLFHSYIIKLLSAILNKILRENFGYVKEFILWGMVNEIVKKVSDKYDFEKITELIDGTNESANLID